MFIKDYYVAINDMKIAPVAPDPQTQKAMKQFLFLPIQKIFSGLALPRIRRWSFKPVIRLKFEKVLSLKYLILIGFVVAVIPLFLAVMYAAFAMRETAALSKATNFQVLEQTKTTRLIMQKVSDIERKARLFVLLADPALRQPYERKSYEAARTSFRQALDDLLKSRVDNKITLLVNELSEKEKLIYEQIIGSENDGKPRLPVDEAFLGLREASNALWREIEEHVDNDVNELRQKSESLEQGLLTKGGALLLFSLVFISTLLAVLSRSIRQLDASIRRLGAGNFADAIVVTGPRDLRYLGERLEWLRARLLELEESKRLFMHNVAREIETPLAQLCEGAEQLAGQETPGLQQHDIAMRLCANAEKLQAVSEELVRYSRINDDLLQQGKETVNMKALLESVIEDYQGRLQAKSLRVRELVQPVSFSGNPEQLRTLIEHLISNAVKFSPVEGEIRIMLRSSGSQMELEIEDEGLGIDANERAHVFEPFFRGKAAHTLHTEGAGLGLAIVREYVANHQGKVDIVEPRQDQHGARIRVQIPLNDVA